MRRLPHLAWADMDSDDEAWSEEDTSIGQHYMAEGPAEDMGPVHAEAQEDVEQEVPSTAPTLAELWEAFAPPSAASGADTAWPMGAATASASSAAKACGKGWLGPSAARAAEPFRRKSQTVQSAARAAEPWTSRASGARAVPAETVWDDWTTASAEPVRVAKGPEEGGANCPLGMHTERNKAKKEKKARRQAVNSTSAPVLCYVHVSK